MLAVSLFSEILEASGIGGHEGQECGSCELQLSNCPGERRHGGR